ncbi:F-actin-monooxygenase MICAL2 [Microcaecilia unicolor]|uniref:Molecule interacting with CasL protein 1 n=1 Tax=Microcaecilia unicolor TaxID=1415580 RepID=A0A6P7ZQJ7_9AMPH|nr:F-actin-monooxygenase MICAL1 [Microcaecilia unicolor]XP_030076990.1 F-actin-monooxygenase MICAL1 [Microcaecilia unicolor]XP_030076991.1 F-actin-monooxygenase MICAL1 [Microcaecilia unicolor]XP_030076992.1 F-actin-monooxygenase MICAL1 [Microcaecilia unicolor]XP_030076993.1 F-actin-monooxygenase MICAL1 [Microcaecilia unicolor]
MVLLKDSGQPNPAHALFERFLLAQQCKETLDIFQELSRCLKLDHEPSGQLHFYNKLKSHLNYWKAKALWTKLDKKAGHNDYNQGKACSKTKCLVIGAGPCGLRTAIELAFLGAKVIVVEKRETFSRNNVLHLWPFTILDLRALGAKKYYGRFCTGTLDHVSIRQLQLILLKAALILGVEVITGVQFKGILPPPVGAHEQGKGWMASFHPNLPRLRQFQFDVLISAGGSKFIPEGFKRKEMRGKLAIGITANFINRNTSAEAKVEEISGVARIYNQKFFQNLLTKTGIDLENIVYYKDDTHYFVMTAKKQSLIKMGVILQDKLDTESLLSPENVNYEALLQYAREAANFSTNYQLPQLEFALNHRNRPDVDMFDFTCMYRAEDAAMVHEHNATRLLVGLVGDCLVEPFWPLGTGVARGFLAAFDAAWMVKKWAAGVPPLEVLAERESIYQRLSQTSPDNTNKDTSNYSINPTTRYPNLNLQAIKPNQVRHLYNKGSKGVDRKSDEQNKRVVFSRKDSLGVYDELLRWCQKQTAGYRNVKVTDLTYSWRSGLALCALIHRFRPDLIDFESLDKTAAAKNNQLAFDVAEQELGILPILTGSEMATVSEPDRLSLVTYLSQFHEAFRDAPILPPHPREREVSSAKIRTLSGAKSAILFLNKVQKTLSLKRTSKEQEEPENKRKRSNDTLEASDKVLDVYQKGPAEVPQEDHLKVLHLEGSPPSPMKRQMPAAQSQSSTGSSDACYFCGQRVYIVERMSANGLFFHRGCFHCHQCGTTLRLGNYAFDEDDGYFYCTLHYCLQQESQLHKTPSASGNSELKPQTVPSADDSVFPGSSPSDPGEPLHSTSLLSGFVPANTAVQPLRPSAPGYHISNPLYSTLELLGLQPSDPVVGAKSSAFPGANARSEHDGSQRTGKMLPFGSETLEGTIHSVSTSRPDALTLADECKTPPVKETDSEMSCIAKKRILLSKLEKKQLARLNSSSDSDSESQTSRERPKQKNLKKGQALHTRDSTQILAETADHSKGQGDIHDKSQAGWVEPRISEENIKALIGGKDGQFYVQPFIPQSRPRFKLSLKDFSARYEEPNEGEAFQDLGFQEMDSSQTEESSDEEEHGVKEAARPTKTQVRLSREDEMKKRETWKMRTLQRRAKEEEMKRFHKAQSIQRRLEEIEECYRQLEQQGIGLELSLREDREPGQSELINHWLLLVQERNVLLSEESDLMIAVQELELEETQSLLDQDLRRYIDMDDRLKTPQDKTEEEEILNKMIEVVDKRNALITFQDEKRLNDITDQLHGLSDLYGKQQAANR